MDPLERLAAAPASPEAWVAAVRTRLLARAWGWTWLGLLALLLAGLGLWLAFGSEGGPARPLPWLRGLLGVALGAAVILSLTALWARLRRRPQAALARLGRQDAALAEDLGSALELRREVPGATDLGHAFARCHLERVEGRLRTAPPAELVPLGGLGHMTRAVALLGSAVALGLVFVPEAPLRLSVHLGLQGGPDALPRVLAGPAARTLRIQVRPPRYTGFGPAVHAPSKLPVTVPEGSRVTVLAEADHPVLAVRAAWPGGGGGGGDLLGESALRVVFTARQDGELVLALEDPAGVWRVGARGPAFRVQRDQPPAVTGRPSAGVIRLERATPFTLQWEATDDHGVTAVRLVYAVDDGTRRQVELGRGPRFGPGRRVHLAGRHRWDLAKLRLAPGSRVRFHLEAEDNRALAGAPGGPQRTASPSQEIRIEGSRAARRDVLEGVRPLLEAALAALADRYEKPPKPAASATLAACAAGRRELERQQGQELALSTAFGGFVERVRSTSRDLPPLLREVFDGPLQRLAGRLAGVIRADRAAGSRAPGPGCEALRRAAAGHGPVVATLEELTLQLDALTGRATLEEMKDVVRRADALRKEIRRLAEQLRQRPDPATRRELARRASELRQQLARLSQLASSLGDEVMDEHVNRYARREGGKKHVLDQLGKQGHPGGDPLAALDRMVDQLKQAVNEGLDRFRQVMPLPGEKTRQRHADGVRSLAEAQRQLTDRLGQEKDPQRLAKAQQDLARQARRLAAATPKDAKDGPKDAKDGPQGAQGAKDAKDAKDGPQGAQGAKGAKGAKDAKDAKGGPKGPDAEKPPGAPPPKAADAAAELRDAAKRMEQAAKALGRGDPEAAKRLGTEALRLLKSAQAAAERAGRLTPPQAGAGDLLEDRGEVEIPQAGGALPRELRNRIQEAGRARWPTRYREALRHYYESLLR